MYIYFNENFVLVTNFKTGGSAEHVYMESDNLNIFLLTFTTEKVHFKQTNILSIKRHQDYIITYRSDHPCIFRAFFVTSYRIYFTKLNFLRRRCREINNKLDMTLNGDVSALT